MHALPQLETSSLHCYKHLLDVFSGGVRVLLLIKTSMHMQAATEPDISIPPLKVPLVYGMACSIQFLLPAAYWYAAHFTQAQNPTEHFEQAVLHAVNSGGNNMARAALTGALVGAMVGASAIPTRLVQGLVGSEQLLQQLDKLVMDAFPDL